MHNVFSSTPDGLLGGQVSASASLGWNRTKKSVIMRKNMIATTMLDQLVGS